MSRYKIIEGNPHFLTMTIVEWVDLFTRKDYCYTIMEAMDYCRQYKGLKIHAYVIMSNHLHMIFSAEDDHKLSGILRDFKQFTSRSIIKLIKEIPESRSSWLLEHFSQAAAKDPKVRHYKVWQTGNHPKVILTRPFMLQKLNYIHQNPVKAMIVEDPTHYIFSSAGDYTGRKGMVEVDLLD